MSRADDMVMVPTIGEQVGPQSKARDEIRRKNAEEQIPKSRTAQRIRNARTAQRIRRLRAAKSSARSSGFSRGGIGGASRAGARFSPRAATRGVPRAVGGGAAVGIAAAVIAIGAVVTRLAVGRSFESIGQSINNFALGDEDDKAKARLAARNRLASDPYLARIAGINGGATGQMAILFESFYQQELREQKGRSALTEVLSVDSLVDIIIVESAKTFQEAWKSSGAADAFEKTIRYLNPNATVSGKASPR